MVWQEIMNHFHYIQNELYCENVPVSKIARDVGTPVYIYSHATLSRHFDVFDSAFKGVNHLTCFSMKSNSNGAVLNVFSQLGGGVDIVSGGELFRALKAGVVPEKIVYSGVGKREEELAYALESGILLFNVESAQEMHSLNRVAERMGKKAKIALRVNPDVDPKTHPYISTGLKENKFGVSIKDAVEQYSVASGLKGLQVAGVSCHIGSQLTSISPFVDALKKLKDLIERLTRLGMRIDYLDLGGGLGITYEDESPPPPTEYAAAIQAELGETGLTLILEPGRVLVGNAGILVAEVIYTKISDDKIFFVVDAAMNDLMRPSLYNSYHEIRPVRVTGRKKVKADIVGPICESGDFLAKNREVVAFEPGELLAVMSAGAYGYSMSSTYNSRPRACEVMGKGDRFSVIREREKMEDLIRGEKVPDF